MSDCVQRLGGYLCRICVTPETFDKRTIEMGLFRFLTILILLPVTVAIGTPLVGCRCSNGEVHLSCPKLRAEQSQKTAAAKTGCGTQSRPSLKSCCSGKKNTSCCGSKSGKSSNEGQSRCAAVCHCTPVVLTVEIGPKLTKVSLPDGFSNLANLATAAGNLVRDVSIDISRVQSKPDVPIDIVLVYERFLI